MLRDNFIYHSCCKHPLSHGTRYFRRRADSIFGFVFGFVNLLALELLANSIVALVVQDDPQHLQGSCAPDLSLQEILEQRRAPAAHHDHAFGICLGVEVTRSSSDVPDNNARRCEGYAPHVLTCALERLADHLDMRLPWRSLDDVTVGVIRVPTLLVRGASLIPVHVCDDDEIVRLLTRATTSLLQIGKDKIHCLLEVCAHTLTDVTD